MTNLIMKKPYGELFVHKYRNKVFYNNLWDTDPNLLESRGKVTDADDNVIALPFKKIFNYKENDTVCDLDKVIIAVRKMNGFMLHVTHNKKYGNIIGTTGSLKSDFVDLGTDVLTKFKIDIDYFKEANLLLGRKLTFIFEIQDKERDPHIIEEDDGVYLLGIRDVDTGELLSQPTCDFISNMINAKRPEWKIAKFGDILEEVKQVDHEGFVIYDIETNEGLLKLKSPYYLSKKWVMRRNGEKMFYDDYKRRMDEEYYPIVKHIRTNYTKDQWAEMSEQARGELFDELLKQYR